MIYDHDKVAWDTFIRQKSEFKKISKMKYNDPIAFWIGAKKGDIVHCLYPAEDAVDNFEYRIVV